MNAASSKFASSLQSMSKKQTRHRLVDLPQMVAGEVEQVFIRGMLSHDHGAGSTAVAMLDSCDDMTSTGKFSAVLCILGSRARESVREQQDRKPVDGC